MTFILVCVGWIIANRLNNRPLFDRELEMIAFALIISGVSMLIS